MSEKFGLLRRPERMVAACAVATGVLGVTAAATYEGPQPVTAAVQDQIETDITERHVLRLSRQAGGIASRGCLPEEAIVDMSGCNGPNVAISGVDGLLKWVIPASGKDAPATLDEYGQDAQAPPVEPAPPPPPTPAPQEATPTPPPPEPQPEPEPPAEAGAWGKLAECESGGDWHINTGNGYYGGLQFSLESWRAVGGQGYPHEHPPEVQIEMAERLKARQGWNAWPVCSRRLGLI